MPWWRSAVVYQIYPRSFADGDGDGVGDLAGIRARLDHLVDLGVDAVWLSPIYRSPMVDFGYDVSDHCAVDPVFGDLATFDRLLADCHARGLRLLLDWVPNHTSDQHPWFVESRSSRHSPKRDWYIWRDGSPDRPPNNWLAAFGGPAWTWDANTSSWYLHLFLPQQPDLNWRNPDVVAAQHGVLRFWLDRGVDGFRADVVHLIGKDEALPDQPEELAHLDLVGVHDHPSTHGLLKGIRALIDSYPGERMMVGEVNLGSAELVAPYYGSGDELPLVFNFALLYAPWDAARWAAVATESEQALGDGDAWPVWVLSNHDQVRHRSRYAGSEARARVAAVVLLTMRGTPFLYAGEELGLENAEVPDGRRVDPGGRDGCRAPIPWTAEPPHGWGPSPWLPFPPDAATRSAATQSADPASIFSLYRRLLRLRRASPALHEGSWHLMQATEDLLVYERRAGDDRRIVVANFGPVAHEVSVAGGWTVDVATPDGGAGRSWNGTVDAETAAILSPVGDDTLHGRATPGHVVLIGLMGAGKSTVGRELAVLLNRPLVDNDAQVLAKADRTVAEISAQTGIAEMRRLESEVLAEALASTVPAVITAAAGVILDGQARRWLEDPFVVWLRADPATLATRVARDPARPLIGDDPETVLRAMHEQRHHLYAEVADHVVDIDRLTPADVAAAIAARL